MCLAIPGLIEAIDDRRNAEISILGIKRNVSLDLVPDATVGDYVLVHAGFGIEIIDEESAKETIEIIKEFPEFANAEESA